MVFFLLLVIHYMNTPTIPVSFSAVTKTKSVKTYYDMDIRGEAKETMVSG